MVIAGTVEKLCVSLLAVSLFPWQVIMTYIARLKMHAVHTTTVGVKGGHVVTVIT